MANECYTRVIITGTPTHLQELWKMIRQCDERKIGLDFFNFFKPYPMIYNQFPYKGRFYSKILEDYLEENHVTIERYLKEKCDNPSVSPKEQQASFDELIRDAVSQICQQYQIDSNELLFDKVDLIIFKIFGHSYEPELTMGRMLQLALTALIRYGYASGLEWCREEWGTKNAALFLTLGIEWDEYRKLKKIKIEMITPNSSPIPIFKALVQKFPGLRIWLHTETECIPESIFDIKVYYNEQQHFVFALKPMQSFEYFPCRRNRQWKYW